MCTYFLHDWRWLDFFPTSLWTLVCNTRDSIKAFVTGLQRQCICKPGHLHGKAWLIYQPAHADMERPRLNSAASSCSDKQGQASLEAQTITEKPAHCRLTNSLQFASCFPWASGQCCSGGITIFICKTETKQKAWNKKADPFWGDKCNNFINVNCFKF